MNFSELVGKTLTAVVVSDDKDEITFTTDDCLTFRQRHEQDCCEHVRVEDIAGDIEDLIGAPILLAEEVSQSGYSDYDYSGDEDKRTVTGWPEGIPVPQYVSESFTWTFYKLSTIKGSVTIRWLGESNGYYSESVSFGPVEE